MITRRTSSDRRAALGGQPVLADEGKNLGGGGRDVGARAEDRTDPGFFEEIVIPRRDNAAAYDEDVSGALLFQRRDQRGHEGLVRRRLARHADDVDVVLDGLASGLFRGLKQ